MSRTYHHGNKAKERVFGSRWRWIHQTPSWWVREMMTKPQRARTRNLLKKVERMKDLEDPPLFPLARKPHVYYW